MKILLPLVLLAGCVLCIAAPAHAGLNAGGTGALYWQNGTSAGLANRKSTLDVMQIVVTVKGVSNFRGADVQLLVNGAGGMAPDAWNFTTTGCNAGNMTTWIGGRGGAYPNLFTSAPELQGTQTSQNWMLSDPSSCLTPHGVFLLWLCSAGAAGVARDPGTEYGVWAVKFDLSVNRGQCAGDPGDPNGTTAVCINPNERIPCNDVQRGAVLEILDGNDVIDYLPFAAGKALLTWGPNENFCPGVTPAAGLTWGQLRKLYR